MTGGTGGHRRFEGDEGIDSIFGFGHRKLYSDLVRGVPGVDVGCQRAVNSRVRER